MFHHVVLKLTRILESLLTLRTPVQGGPSVDSQVSLQLSQCGEVQTALHADVLLPFFMLQLVGAELTGVSKASAAHAAAVRLDVAVLHHVSLQVAGLREGLVAHLALVGPHALMCEQMCVQVAELLEQLTAQVAAVRLDAVVAQDVCDQVVLGGVRLLTHTALPPLLVAAHVDVIAVIHVDAEAQLLRAARPTPGGFATGAVSGAEVLFGVESTRREVHERSGHEEVVWEKVRVERREVGMVEEEGRRRPNSGGTEGLLLHLHR